MTPGKPLYVMLKYVQPSRNKKKQMHLYSGEQEAAAAKNCSWLIKWKREI